MAGPALIIVAVLIVHHAFAFGGMLTTEHIDILPFWLPTYCHLGESLGAGHVPLWNSFAMAGVPFAADPQSGWGYLPAMVLFTTLPCDVAMRWFIVAQPILAGLGIYWFLRGERCSRQAATAGGILIALVMANSFASLALPFAGSLAWTALLLAAASRYLRAEDWAGRLLWAGLSSLGWSQLAAAQPSDGLLLGTAALGAYLLARTIAEVRRRERSLTQAAGHAFVLFAALPLGALAVIVPRLAYLPRTNLALGYTGLDELAARLAGQPDPSFQVGTASPTGWVLGLALYLGVPAFILCLASWRSRRHVHLFAAFGLFGLVSYILSLEVVARLLQGVLGESTVGQFYLHEPWRFRYGVVLALPVLAPLGLEAWREAGCRRDRVLVLAPGIVGWFLLMGVLGIGGSEPALLAIGAAAGAAAFVASMWRPSLMPLFPAVIAVELVTAGLVGQVVSRPFAPPSAPGRAQALPWLRAPDVLAEDYLRPGALVGRVEAGRYAVVGAPGRYGYLGFQRPQDWAGLANQRSMLFELESADGYNPTQLLRYWSFVRAASTGPMEHNSAFLARPEPVALDLLGVRWLIAPVGATPEWVDVGPDDRQAAEEGAIFRVVPTARDGSWELFEVAGAATAVTVVDSWRVAPSPEAALRMVMQSGFDPQATAVLEEAPGPSAAGAGNPVTSATFRWLKPGLAAIDVTARRPSVAITRIPFDRNWRATVDGHPEKIIPANYVVQGVAIPAGRHRIVLRYHEPWLGLGLAGSGIGLVALLGSAAWLRWRSSARR